jgi:N-acyl-D-amino-acid deacylase
VVIRNGLVYDGTGTKPFSGGVAVRGDSIVAVGDISAWRGKQEIDAKGMAIAPGFINMLSWATTSLLVDGRSQGDIRQGVTLEVMGEGWSMGPWSDGMKTLERRQQGNIKFPIEWTTLGEYLAFLEKRGVSCNVASFVGATTLRIHEIGYANRPPTAEELERMKALVRQAMEEGALGVGSSLIYAPAFYAQTEELIELCKAAAPYGGMYISHLRSEGDRWEEAVDELIRIAREARVPAEIYHLKAAGQANWGKVDAIVRKIDSANKAGTRITANMYTYIAGATGLDASMPPWVQEGGYDEWAKRLQEPSTRARVKAEMKQRGANWENLYFGAGSAEKLLLVEFERDSLKKYTGKTLAEVARMRGQEPEDAAMDLVIEDGSRVGTVYFLMSEDNVKRQLQLPYVSLGSDAASMAPEGVFLSSSTHPRAYGNVARFLGKYVRDEKLMPLEEGIRRLTSLPASNLNLQRRGTLRVGHYADIVVFDPEAVRDHATFDKPHQYSTGMTHVLVNGVQVLRDGNHTGAKPGRAVRGAGWKQQRQ